MGMVVVVGVDGEVVDFLDVVLVWCGSVVE